jgi:hypothetical protein
MRAHPGVGVADEGEGEGSLAFHADVGRERPKFSRRTRRFSLDRLGDRHWRMVLVTAVRNLKRDTWRDIPLAIPVNNFRPSPAL